MRLAALLVSLLLLVTGCGDDVGEGGSLTDVCDRLTLEAASEIVGVDYTANGQVSGICIYRRPGTDLAFSLNVIAYEDDYDKVLGDSAGLGYTTKDVEVPGADRAVALSGKNRGVLAEQDGDAYEVSFNGDVATAIALMTRFLNGDDVSFEPGRAEDPCRSLSAADVRRVLGVPAKAKPGTRELALKSCTWRSGGRELVVAAGIGRGPVEEFWDENFFVGEGVKPDSVRLPGADGALLVSTKKDDTVGLAVTKGERSYVVTVGGGVPDPRGAADDVATALLRRS